MSSASDLDCFRATCDHEQPSRILYYASFTPDLHRRVQEYVGDGHDISEHFGFMKSAPLPIRRPEGLLPIDYSSYWEGEDLAEGTRINEWGVADVPSGFFHFSGLVSPLRNAMELVQLEEYPLDDMSDWDFSYMKEIVHQAHLGGKIVIGHVGHIYETAWQIRGYEEFLIDIMERPAWAECLLERLARQNMVKARAFAEAGADMIRCGDDVASQNALMFSPDWWLAQHHARWSKIWAEVEQINPQTQIWYHSDGNVEAIIEHLVDSGLNILNPLQPECMDIEAVHRRYGDRLTFDGCLGTQSTMPFGSADDVRSRVKDLIDRYGQSGGLMVSPTHVLEPEVPIENIQAFADTCRESGTFG